MAYNLYLPLHAVTMGALPVALSKLTSKYNASGNNQMLYGIKKASHRLFMIFGMVAMSIMLVGAFPYSKFVSSPNGVYTIIALSPSLLFSVLSASHNNYYEGLMNMKPTAFSQLIDAVFKMIFGLLFAKLSMAYLLNEYALNTTVLGKMILDENEALSRVFSITSACAMLGACFGSFSSMTFAFLYDVINRDNRIKSDKNIIKSAKTELLAFTFPIMISCAVQSVFQFLDTASVQYAISLVDENVIKSFYPLSDSNDLVTYVFGIYSTALDFKNLIVGVTMSLGICAVPAISREHELKNSDSLSKLVNLALKYTMLLSLLGGVILTLFSREILTLFYSSQELVDGCNNIVKYFGFTVVFYSLSGTAVNAVQAIGCPQKSIKPFVVCGIIRVVLNLILIQNDKLLLMGAVISGAVSYFVMCIWNILIVKKQTDVGLQFVSVVIKPMVIFLVTYFVMQKIDTFVSINANVIFNLLIKVFTCVVIFCILCFSLKSLNFSRKILH